MCSQSAVVAFKMVVIPARAILGEGSLSLPAKAGWAGKKFNIDDPVKIALAGRLQLPGSTHAAGSTSCAYVSP
jgi:hypothetical protein